MTEGSTTTVPSSSPTSSARPSEAPAAAVPGPVTVLSARSGGGSGEVVVDWDAIVDAAGYRVYRSQAPAGPFVASAAVDAVTGTTTIEFVGAYEYLNIWRPSPQTFQYVESAYAGGPVYFQVRAFNATGEGPASVVVCGSPVGSPGC